MFDDNVGVGCQKKESWTTTPELHEAKGTSQRGSQVRAPFTRLRVRNSLTRLWPDIRFTTYYPKKRKQSEGNASTEGKMTFFHFN